MGEKTGEESEDAAGPGGGEFRERWRRMARVIWRT